MPHFLLVRGRPHDGVAYNSPSAPEEKETVNNKLDFKLLSALRYTAGSVIRSLIKKIEKSAKHVFGRDD